MAYSEFLTLTPAELQAISAGYYRKLNREAWMFGHYTLEALTAVLSAAMHGKGRASYQYPTEPRMELQPLTRQEQAQYAKNERLRVIAYCNQLVERGKSWVKAETADTSKVQL